MPNNPNDYQVQQNDKDLLTIAQKQNLPLEALIAANPNIKSVSQGQYIRLPQLTPKNFNFPSTPKAPTAVPTGSFLSAGGTKVLTQQKLTPRPQPTQGQQIGQQYAQQWIQAQKKVSPLAPPMLIGKQERLDDQEIRINQQLAAGSWPVTVPVGVTVRNPVDGSVVSSQEMAAKGYVYSPLKQQWELSTAKKTELGIGQTTAPANANVADTTPSYLQNVVYNGKVMQAWQAEAQYNRENDIYIPRSTKEALKIQNRNRIARREAEAFAAQTPAIVEQRNANDFTTLNIRLGS